MTQKWFSCAAGLLVWENSFTHLSPYSMYVLRCGRCCCCAKTTPTGASSVSFPHLLVRCEERERWTGREMEAFSSWSLIKGVTAACPSSSFPASLLSLRANVATGAAGQNLAFTSTPNSHLYGQTEKGLMHRSIFIVSVVPSVELKERQFLYSLQSVFKSELAILRLPCLLLSHLPFKHLVKQQIEMFNEKWVLSNCVEGMLQLLYFFFFFLAL